MADRFDKFSERARLTLMLAQEEAQRFGHTFIGTEHIVLGIVRQPDSTATKVLDALGALPVAVRAAVEAAITRGGPVVLGEIGLTSRAKKAIEYAVDEARRLESHVIGTEHLLLGILGQDGDLAATVLDTLGVTLDAARAEVRRRLARVAPRPTLASQRSIGFRSAGRSGPRDALEATTRALRILHDTAGWLERDNLAEDAAALRDIQLQLARFVTRDTRRLISARGEPAGPDATGRLVLFGGPAGAGKSTLAAAWCATRPRAVHIELDAVRELIVAGRADPQGHPGAVQAAQYALSVTACLHLASVFLDAGYDVAIDDVLEPEAFAVFWRPALAGRIYQLVVVTPSLDATLARAAARAKQVRPDIIRRQHEASLAWPAEHRIDTSALSADQSLALVVQALTSRPTAG